MTATRRSAAARTNAKSTRHPESSQPEGEETGIEYRVGELAAAAGTSIRNVRVYQDRGLLPPPRRQGRIGLYSQAHLGRLRLISRLLARGYTFATIRELLDAAARGRDLDQVLGLEDELALPWTEEKPERVTRAALNQMFGMDENPALRERAIRLGLLQPTDDVDTVLVLSPRLLAAGRDLVAAGVPLTFVLDLAELLAEDMARVAQRVFGTVGSLLLGDIELDDSPERRAALAQTIRVLRPHAQQTADVMLAMAMARESKRFLEDLTGRRSAR